MLNPHKLKSLTESLVALFVEDDEDLLRSNLPILERFFKKVDTASDGKKALERYTTYKNDTNDYYHIVITDIQMPYMNGIDLSKALLKMNPLQKIIITSAYNDKEYLIPLINIGVSGFLEKPIDYDNMLEVLFNVSSLFMKHNRIQLFEEFSFDMTEKILYNGNEIIELSVQEQKMMELFCKKPNHYFNAIDIFNHIYYDQIEKEFSIDSIKSLIKRLRKKIPDGLIQNMQSCGYCIKI